MNWQRKNAETHAWKHMQLSSRAHRNISVNYETIFDEAFVKLHIKTMAFAHDVTRKSLRQIDTATATKTTTVTVTHTKKTRVFTM